MQRDNGECNEGYDVRTSKGGEKGPSSKNGGPGRRDLTRGGEPRRHTAALRQANEGRMKRERERSGPRFQRPALDISAKGGAG